MCRACTICSNIEKNVYRRLCSKTKQMNDGHHNMMETIVLPDCGCLQNLVTFFYKDFTDRKSATIGTPNLLFKIRPVEETRIQNWTFEVGLKGTFSLYILFQR